MNQVIRVKFLYRAATDELESGHPFAAGMTVSLLQDAVEAMAHDAAAAIGASTSARASFLDYWEAAAKVSKPLPYRSEMNTLNQARVGFKHHGVDPSLAEAEKHVLAAHRFLQEVGLQFLGVDFDGLSEVDLVSDGGIRTALKAAEDALAGDDAKTALERCRDALDVLESLQKKTIPVSEHDHFGPPVPREVRQYADGIVRWLQRRFTVLETALSMSILNVNPADYWFLNKSLPMRNPAGVYHWVNSTSLVPTQTPARARACIRIIINLAMRLDRLGAEFKRLEAQAGLPEERRRTQEWRSKMLGQVSAEPKGPANDPTLPPATEHPDTS